MYNAIAANKRNTVIIMTVFVGIIGGIGYLLSSIYGNSSITPWIVGGALFYALIQYFLASKLAVMSTGAQEIEKSDNPRMYRIVENLAITEGLPMPKVYIIDDPAPNAFATGRDPQHALVAATTGLLDIMNDQELEGVLAHEMAHIKNYDIRVSMAAVALTAVIGVLSDIVLRFIFLNDDDEDSKNPIALILGLFFVLISPFLATITRLAISRQREFLADATAVSLTRYPDGLISALEKLKNNKPLERQNSTTASLFISNPMKQGFFQRLFSTHPPLDDRINRLKENSARF